ncbi:Rap guanine nucleotide exchange factor 4, partial [Fragariocoptes setiger]
MRLWSPKRAIRRRVRRRKYRVLARMRAELMLTDDDYVRTSGHDDDGGRQRSRIRDLRTIDFDYASPALLVHQHNSCHHTTANVAQRVPSAASADELQHFASGVAVNQHCCSNKCLHNVYTRDTEQRVISKCGSNDVVGVCTLGVGTTFGASGITSGKTHSVSAITSDECTLLRVRRADFEQIFQSTTSLTPSMLLGMAPSDSQDQSPPSGGGGSGGGGGLVDMWHNANNYGMSASNCAWTGQKQQQLASTSSQRSSLTSGGGGGGGSMTTTPIASGDKHRQQQQQEYTGSSMTAAGGQQQEQFNQQMQGQQQQSDNRSSGSGNNMANFNDADLNGPEAIEIALANQEADADDAASDAGSCSSGTDEVLRLAHASAVLRTLIHAHARAMLQDRHVVFAASDQALDNRNNNNQETNNQQQQQQPAPQVVQNAMAGSEMVDWLMGVAGELVGGTMRGVHTRLQASAMWHALLEVGELHAVGGCARAQPCVAMGVCQCGHATTSANESSTSHTQQLAGPAAAYINFNSLKMAPRASAFKCSTAAAAGTTRTNSNSNNSMCAQQRQAPRFRDESHVLYRFKWDQPSCAANNNVDCNNNNSNSNWGAHSSAKFPPIDEAECALLGVVVRLARLAPSASFRLVLAKPAAERTHDELELVYDELRHIKALSHLSQSAKKELAARVAYEHHARANECVFQQGEPGHSWYVILRGSVHVIIDGKGTVCSLHAGDDFGKLALINEAPRAATIVTGEPYCYFLRVDKHDFDQILRHLEANTVRLQEHGKEVLILQRVVAKDSASESGKTSAGVVTSSTLLGTCNDTNNQVSSSSTSSTTSVANNNISMAPTAIGGSNTSNNNHHLINAANLSAASGGTATDVATLSSSNLSSSSAANKQVTFKYTVMAGTPEKMLVDDGITKLTNTNSGNIDTTGTD